MISLHNFTRQSDKERVILSLSDNRDSRSLRSSPSYREWRNGGFAFTTSLLMRRTGYAFIVLMLKWSMSRIKEEHWV